MLRGGKWCIFWAISTITWISQVSNRKLSIIIPIFNVVNTLELLNREK